MKTLATKEILIEHQTVCRGYYAAHIKTAKRRFKIKNQPVLRWIKRKPERATRSSALKPESLKRIFI